MCNSLGHVHLPQLRHFFHDLIQHLQKNRHRQQHQNLAGKEHLFFNFNIHIDNRCSLFLEDNPPFNFQNLGIMLFNFVIDRFQLHRHMFGVKLNSFRDGAICVQICVQFRSFRIILKMMVDISRHHLTRFFADYVLPVLRENNFILFFRFFIVVNCIFDPGVTRFARLVII